MFPTRLCCTRQIQRDSSASGGSAADPSTRKPSTPPGGDENQNIVEVPTVCTQKRTAEKGKGKEKALAVPLGSYYADRVVSVGFDNVRIPRENLLNSVADVSPDGKYLSAIKNLDQRFGAFLAPLASGRVPISVKAVYAAKTGMAIAIRYALSRRAFLLHQMNPRCYCLITQVIKGDSYLSLQKHMQ